MHTRDIRTGAGVGTWSAAAAVLIAGTAQGLAQESAGLSDLREESQRSSVTTGVIEDFGFDLAEERARFERYQAYFDVPSELRSDRLRG